MPLIAGLIGVIAFSLNDLLYRAMSPHVGVWIMISALNAALAALAWGILLLRKEALWPKNFWGYPLLLAVIKALNIFFALLTFQQLPVALAYLFIFTYPIWVAVIDGLMRRMFAKRYLFSLLLGASGIGLVFYRAGFVFSWGIIFALLSALCVAGGILIARRCYKESALALSVSNATVCLTVGLLGALLTYQPRLPTEVLLPVPVSLWQWAALLLLSVIASLSSLYAAQKIPSTRYALLCYLQIPLAVLLAWAWLSEPISWRVGVGLVLIVIGSLTAQLKGWRKKKLVVVAARV